MDPIPLPYISPDGSLCMFGRWWYDVERTPADDLACRAGHHVAALWGISDGGYVERCSCGAIRYDLDRMWIAEKSPRYVTPEPARRWDRFRVWHRRNAYAYRWIALACVVSLAWSLVLTWTVWPAIAWPAEIVGGGAVGVWCGWTAARRARRRKL